MTVQLVIQGQAEPEKKIKMLINAVVLTTLCLLYSQVSANTTTCPITPYVDVDVSKVGGTWYAVRGIEHDSVKQTSRQRNNKACPVITFTVQDPTHVQFSYDSKNGSEPKKYNMSVKDAAVPSLWTTEKGNKKHVPFNKLQVNDAGENTLALTMCGTHRLASVILSREKRFNQATVDAITQRLAAKGLNTNRSFDRCKE